MVTYPQFRVNRTRTYWTLIFFPLKVILLSFQKDNGYAPELLEEKDPMQNHDPLDGLLWSPDGKLRPNPAKSKNVNT